MSYKIDSRCKSCWWKPVCKKTGKACKIIQGVDARWDESPNNDDEARVKRIMGE